jgi:hypothetical protein
MDMLKRDTWSADRDFTKIISDHVVEHANDEQTCCIFPECGSGFHQWRAVEDMMERCYVRTVLLMDSCVRSRWQKAWNSLAEQHGVEVLVASSYDELFEVARSLPAQIRKVVVYVDGAFRVRTQCLPAATEFWGWCDSHVANAPVNFVNGCATRPGNCTDWGQLAECWSLT